MSSSAESSTVTGDDYTVVTHLDDNGIVINVDVHYPQDGAKFTVERWKQAKMLGVDLLPGGGGCLIINHGTYITVTRQHQPIATTTA